MKTRFFEYQSVGPLLNELKITLHKQPLYTLIAISSKFAVLTAAFSLLR